MTLRNAFENLALDSTLAAVRDRLADTLVVNVTDRAARTLGHVVVDTVSGTVDVADRAARALGVVTVANLPQVQEVLGRVAVINFPATQTVAGTVTVANPTTSPETGLAKNATLTDGTQKSSVTNFPSLYDVADRAARLLGVVDVVDRASRVLGTVAVSNFPTSTVVAGSVEVANDIGNPLPVVGSVNANTGLAQPLTEGQLRALPVQVATGLFQPLTDAQLRAARVGVDTGLTQPLTDAQLRAAGLPVTGTFFPQTQPVSGPLTDTQLRAARVPVDTALTQPLTDAQLRAAGVPVTGTFWPQTQPVSGPLTDTQLRAARVPVDNGQQQGLTDAQLRAARVGVDTGLSPLTNTELRATRLPVDTNLAQPLTDAQLRAAGVPVTGTFFPTTQPVSGPLTDTQLRAAPVPVSNGQTQPLTDTQLRAAGVPVTGTFWPTTQPVSGPLTDAQLRAARVGVDTGLTPLTNAELRATPVPVSNGLVQALTNAELRATPVPVSNGLVQALTDAQLRAAAVPVVFAAAQATDVTDRAARALGAVRIATPAQLAAQVEATAFAGQQSMRATLEPSTLFIDFFDNGLIDPNRWTTTGTGVSASTGRYVSIEPGTAANAMGQLTSVPNFASMSDAYTRMLFTFTIGGAIITGNYRFMGMATLPATPTIDIPVQDGPGFEVRTDGTMWAVIWQGGARLWSQQVTRPTDGNWHRGIIQTKTSGTLFFIDGSAVPVAVASLVAPGVQGLPIRVLSLNGPAALTAATTFRFGVVSIGDTGKNSMQISDGLYPHRKARVDESGAVLVSSAGRRSATATAPANVTVPTANLVTGQGAQIIAANPNRLSLLLQNVNSNVDVFIGYGVAPTTANGIRIARGAQLTETNYTGPIFAVSGSATATVVCPYVEVSLA